jgi:hypothetical protein
MSGALTSTETVLRLRAARDRMIDVLGLGETYPIRDLPVPNDRLKVSFNATATIRVEDSEKQVSYGLRDKDGNPAGAVSVGTGDTITLTTPPIRNDITYTVHARTPVGREAELFQTGNVKVGLDVTIAAAVLPEDGPTPRLLDFNATVTVLIPFSQDGVDYRLVRFAGDKDPPHPDDVPAAAQDDVVSDGNHIKVRGTGGPIQLPSKPLQADTVLRIRAIKEFDAALHRQPETNILTVRLPLFVRADPGLTVTSDPGQIFDFQTARFARIAAAQAGVQYRAVQLPVADAAFAQGVAAAPDIVAVPVPGQPDAMIRMPSLAATDALTLPAGFAVAADWQAGGGADLRLALPPAATDMIVAVAARKTHLGEAGSFVSSVWLTRRFAQLIRPNPSPALSLSVTLGANGTDGALAVAGGQPGVFYTPRVAPAGAPIVPPAYMHQRNPDDPATNKGIGQLKLSVDFVVARTGQPPRPPRLATDVMPAGTTLTIQAMMAQSRVAIDLPAQAVIAALPSVQSSATLLDHGGTAHVLVQASLATDSYALFQEEDGEDTPVGAARDGNGQTLDFASNALIRDTVLVLVATSKAPIPVRRRSRLSIAVRPDPSLGVRAQDTTVAPSGTTAILIDGSETGMSYQVVAGGAPVGQALRGTGATLALPVGPLTATTTFSVSAARLSPPAAKLTLTGTATVKVNAS